MEITELTNFMRIFCLPTKYPEGFLFDGGKSVNFQMVDWFEPIERDFESDGNLKIPENMDEHRDRIRDFIRGKVYYDEHYLFLAISDYGDAFII